MSRKAGELHMSRMGELIEAEAAARAADEAAKPPCVNCNGKATVEKPRPRYEWHKPLMVRLFGSGCSSCGSNGLGWVQSHLVNPDRKGRWFPRTVLLSLWVVSLFPRGWSLARTVFSRRMSEEETAARTQICSDRAIEGGCGVRFLKFKGGEIIEELHCGKCNCARTRFAAIRRKNRKAGWRCPVGLHDGSNRDAAYQEYVQVQTQATGDSGGNGNG